MKIVYLSGSTIPAPTADSIHVMKMCNSFAGAGHEVTLVARRGERAGSAVSDYYGAKNEFEIVGIVPSGRGHFGEWRYAMKATRIVRKCPSPDIVYCRHLPSAMRAAAMGFPVVFEAHQPPSRVGLWQETRLFQQPNFKRLVVISNALRSEYQRIHPKLPAGKIVVCADAADEYHNVTHSLPSSDRLRVGYAGSLLPGRGLEIIQHLANRTPEMEFHIVGGSEESFREVTGRSRAQSNLKLHGLIEPGSVPGFLASMDILIAPYQHNLRTVGGCNTSAWMSPMKIFEYMAAGKAIIASDLPVLREVLVNNQNALLVCADDPDDWESALRYLSSPKPRRMLAENARLDMGTRYTWSIRAQNALQDLRTAPQGHLTEQRAG